MPWWSWRPGPANGGDPETRSGITVEGTVRVGPPTPRQPEDDSPAVDRPAIPEMRATVEPVTLGRVCEALDLLDVRYWPTVTATCWPCGNGTRCWSPSRARRTRSW